MKHIQKIISSLVLAVAAQTLWAQSAALTYYTSFDTPAEQAGWTVFRKNAAASTYSWIIDPSGYSGANCIKHEYPVAASSPTEDWYVSPVFNFGAGGKIDSLRTNFSGFGVPASGDTVGIYLLTGSPNPTVTTSRAKLFDFRGADYTADGAWKLKTNITIPAKGGQSYLAFKYTTTNNWLDVKFDNLRVKINSTVGLPMAGMDDPSVFLFPNPPGKSVTFKSNDVSLQDETMTLELYDVMGGKLSDKAIELSKPVDHGLPPGIYFYTLTSADSRVLKHGRIIVKSD